MNFSLKNNYPSMFPLLEGLYGYIRRMRSISDQHLLEGIVLELQKNTPISSLLLAQFKKGGALDPIQFRCCASVNITDEYKKHYVSNNLSQIDSILKYSNSVRIPITWNTALNSKYRNMEFESFLNDINFKHGLAYSFKSSFQSYASYLAFESKTYDCLDIQCIAISYLLPFFHEIINSEKCEKDTTSKPEKECCEITPREKEVLQWVMEGKTNWEISIILSISEGTVRYHITKILRKLNATNCSHAIAKALKYNIFSL
ncbi:MAG: LuxR C-terminal-related transcriptional regulator [Candidatus Thiodiazotropha sp. (ex Dulcina madagascariensis)]|nr:LuxR C-terminal-related transcriptional regulator [Candidatus Thiodiazotropha sp. (ex Dulcina madagascariensis)]